MSKHRARSSQFADARQDLSNLEVESVHQEERIQSPSAARSLFKRFCDDDKDSSANRAAVQELKDFVPPYNEAEMEERGMADRFNINFGVATALINEAIGPFLDIFTTPTTVSRIRLQDEVDPDMRETWASIMDQEWTKMIRSWDAMTSNVLQVCDIMVTHGVSIPWFEDKSTLKHEVGSLEDFKFDADAEAVPSKLEVFVVRRRMQLSQLYQKVEGHEKEEDYKGWNGPEVVRLIENAKPKNIGEAEWNYEEAGRMVKACRAGNINTLPTVDLIWILVRELDGSLSVYVTTEDDEPMQGGTVAAPKDEKWVYRKRNAYENAGQMLNIFTFSVGNKNRIYTIRGFGYALYESGQADNILRCKMMDSARHRASEIYQPESSVDSLEDLQFIDLGHAMIAPKGLRGVQSFNTMRMDENIIAVLQSNQQVMDRHSSGLASSSIVNNPSARRNEMQVTAELEHTNKMQGFAMSLYNGPWDKYIRELIRRSFNETQSDPEVRLLVSRMKDACVARGVPRDVLSKIDLAATQATRLQGAGSKTSRLISFQQLASLYPSMDPQGQEYFNFDYAAEIKGSDAAVRYFGIPGQRRGHVDIALARLENNDLLEGSILEPVDGENKMVHLREHLDELVAGLSQVNEGAVDISVWTMQNIPLYDHTVKTLEQTSVHESRLQELNSMRQQVQQAGEVINNGLRHINKIREQEGDMSQGLAPDGQGQAVDPNTGAPVDPEQAQKLSAAQADNDLKMAKIFAEAQAKIQVMREMSEAKKDIMQSESSAKIGILDAQAAAEIRRKEILARATQP